MALAPPSLIAVFFYVLEGVSGRSSQAEVGPLVTARRRSEAALPPPPSLPCRRSSVDDLAAASARRNSGVVDVERLVPSLRQEEEPLEPMD